VVPNDRQRSEGELLIKRTQALALAVAVMTCLVACGRPPLSVSQQGQSIRLDMQSLGEYPSHVALLRIIDATQNEVVWEVKGRDEPQLGRVLLTVGENSVRVTDVRHGAYEVIAPAGKSTFTLAPGTRYVVEAWGSDSNPRTKRVAEFTTPES
jgi:hypothetical protein